MIKKNSCFILILLLLAGTTMTACDSNDDELSDAALEDFTNMMVKTFGVFSLLSIELVPESTSQKAAASKDIFSCPEGGEVDFNVTNVGGENNTIKYNTDFNDCNGINGSLQYEIGGEFNQDRIDMSIIINGSLSESCSISFSNFSENIVGNLGGTTPSFTFTINGRISSTCGNESFACLFDNDSFGSSDTSFFQDRCALSNR